MEGSSVIEHRDPGDETTYRWPQPSETWEDYIGQFGGREGSAFYGAILTELARLHQEKSSSYGAGDDTFANFTAVAQLTGRPRYYYALLRDLEKTTRCLSLIEQGREDELGEEFKDKASLMVCAEAMRRLDARAK